MTKDQNKETNARTAVKMSKGEKIRLALYLGKCVKGTWKRALEITGELLSRFPLNPKTKQQPWHSPEDWVLPIVVFFVVVAYAVLATFFYNMDD